MDARLKHSLITILVLVCIKSYGQNNNPFTIQDYVQKLTMHLDSFHGLIPIKSGMFLIDSDSVNLKDEYVECYYDYETRYPEIKPFLVKGSNDSVAVLLYFYENRLIEFAIFTKEGTLINNSDIYIQQSCKNSNIEISYEVVSNANLLNSKGTSLSYEPKYNSKYIEAHNKTLEFEFFESFLKNNALLRVADKRTWSVVPSWCGTK